MPSHQDGFLEAAVEVDRLVEALADPGEKYSTLRTNARNGALVFMGCWLGRRWNEAIGVRICDLDLQRREAFLIPTPRAGLAGRRVTWLTLWHTAESLMSDAELTIFDVQQRFGHGSPSVAGRR